MRPHSSSAYLTSLILHAFVAALIALSAYFVARHEAMPKIIELVAGPATDMNSLEAPAEGVPNPVKMTVPVPKVEPQAQPQPEQTQSVPETPVVKSTPAKAPPVPKAKSELSLAKQMAKAAQGSYKDFLKKHPLQPAVPAAPRTAANVPRIDTKGVIGGVKGGSTASRGGQGGTAMTREEADQLSTYISYLIQELKRAHEPPPGVSDRLECKVTFDITASGAILNPKITRSSGNREFDESVLDAFRRMKSIGPTPNRRADTWTVTFRMKEDA